MPRLTISVCVGGGGHRVALVMSRMRSTRSRGRRKDTWTVSSAFFACMFMVCLYSMPGMRRKAIPWKTRCAAALSGACPSCGFRYLPYEDTKQKTEAEFLSQFELHHNIFHESGHRDRDLYWNLTWMLIKAHREQTKRDLATIAKGRRIRRKQWEHLLAMSGQTREPALLRKLRSRGFDKTKRRKMSGKVVPR